MREEKKCNVCGTSLNNPVHICVQSTPSQPTEAWEKRIKDTAEVFLKDLEWYKENDPKYVPNMVFDYFHKLHLEAEKRGEQRVLDVAEGMVDNISKGFSSWSTPYEALKSLLSKFPKHN